MNRYFIVTGTITYAIKGRDVLRRNGYHAEMTRTVQSTGNVGCGYGVLTDCKPEKIKTLFSENGIRYLQIKQQ